MKVRCCLLLLSVVSVITEARERRCCKYNVSKCPSQDSCIIHQKANNSFFHPDLDHCNVERDSKSRSPKCFQSTDGSINGGDDFDWLELFERPPFKLNAFVFKDELTPGDGFPGVEVEIDYSKEWNVAEFSMVNKEVFNSSERCVRIIKNHDAHELGKKFTFK